LTGFIFSSYLVLQVVLAGLYFVISGSTVYENPILGAIELVFAYRIFSIIVIFILILYLIFLKKNSYLSCPEPNAIAFLIESNIFLKTITLIIWPVYILDIYSGHVFLAPVISFFVNVCGPLSFFVPYFQRKNRILFFVLLLLASPFAFASGARGPLFFPIGLFIIGFILDRSTKFKSVVRVFAIGIFIVLVSSGLAVARYSIKYNHEMPLSDQLSIVFDTFFDLVIISDYGLVFISLFIERIVQWPILVAIHSVSELGNVYPHSWLDEFIFSLTLSGFVVDSVNIQERILESGMLYGAVTFLGYTPSVGWTIPLNLFSESVMRGGVFQFFIVVLFLLIAIEILSSSRSTTLRYYMAVMPGYILIRFSETHSVYLVKDFLYFLIFLYFVKLIKRRSAVCFKGADHGWQRKI
jgi:hypothetical protein